MMSKRSRTTAALLAAILLLSGLAASCTPSSQEGDTTDADPTATDPEAVATDEVTSPTEETTVGAETTEADTGEEEPVQAPDSVIAALSPSYGETVCVANSLVAEYASAFTVGYSANYHDKGDIYAPLPLTLTWEDMGADCYRVRLATSADFSDSQVVLTADNSVSFHNPMTGTAYYWQVEALFEDKTLASAIFTFQTADTPRTVYIDGVTNTRDVGGYAISETTRFRLGMVYRSAYVHQVTEEGLYQAKEELGIRCELDLRAENEVGGATTSSLGEDVLYYNISGIYYSDIQDKNNWKTLAEEIKVFADPNNYPMLVHCSLGRDRTGTAIMLVMALCGVSEEDLYCDYELSFFSGLCCGDTTETMLSGQFTPMLDYIKAKGKKDTLQENVEAFLLKIGVTDEEIASIRAILVEEVQ